MRDSRSLLILVLGLGVVGLMSIPSNRSVVSLIILLVLTYLLLQFATRPLAWLIARIGLSIRWKLEVATVIIAILFLSVGLITFGAMEFMHDELHEIQKIGPKPACSGSQSCGRPGRYQPRHVFHVDAFPECAGRSRVGNRRRGDGLVGDKPCTQNRATRWRE